MNIEIRTPHQIKMCWHPFSFFRNRNTRNKTNMSTLKINMEKNSKNSNVIIERIKNHFKSDFFSRSHYTFSLWFHTKSKENWRKFQRKEEIMYTYTQKNEFAVRSMNNHETKHATRFCPSMCYVCCCCCCFYSIYIWFFLYFFVFFLHTLWFHITAISVLSLLSICVWACMLGRKRETLSILFDFFSFHVPPDHLATQKNIFIS